MSEDSVNAWLSRALLRQPDILLFDEPPVTWTRAERAIQESLRGVFKHKTVMLVAHRLSNM